MHRIKRDALFLIDGSYLLYRSYYGLRSLQTSKGIQTQAIYGFCRTINKLIEVFDPQNIILVWDSKGKTFRSELYSEYKATRQAPPSDLFFQKEQIIKFADLIGLKQVAQVGYEADDLIGSLVYDFKNEQIVIVGPDKDLYQLLCDNVLIYDPFKDRIIDEPTFKNEKGYPPEKVAFFYSLIGDASDNIPGVAGIGPKTAQDIVLKNDSLEDLYKNLDKIEKERTRKLLEKNKDNAFLSYKLFSLKYYDLGLKPKDFEFDKTDSINALNFFEEFEFLSLVKELKTKFGKEFEKTGKSKLEGQMSLFEKEKNIPEAKSEITEPWECFIVETEEGLKKLISLLKEEKLFAFDVETTGFRSLQDELVGFSVAANKKEAFYVPVGHKNEGGDRQLELTYVLNEIRPIFEDPKIKKILHNAKFDELMFWQYGIDVQGVEYDTLLAANLLRSNDSEKINLKILSSRYLNEPMTTFDEVIAKKYKDFSYVPIQNAAEYGAYDSLQTFKLRYVLQHELKKHKKIEDVYENIELPLSQVLFRMERFGITLDKDILIEVGKEIEKDLEHIEKKIRSAVEHSHKNKFESFNLNSPKQVEVFLFDELKLPVVKKSGKGQRSTDQEVLEELSKLHPIPGLILSYRELTKLKSTYIESLIKEINPKTGRVHTTYSQTMVATGRLSSSNPNLQNIPASSPHGIKIRSAFVAPTGKVFLSADYSQAELRVLAHLTKDKHLIDAFLNEVDIHTKTASLIFDLPIEKVDHEKRQIGKKINFSIIYGMTPFGLSKDLSIKPSEAKEYIEKYFATYAGVAKWIEETVEEVKKNGYTQTWFGRRRYVPEIYEHNKHLFEAARRVAINSPVQGTSAEILKIAMINIDKKFRKNELKACMILQIHDELVVELPKKEEEIVEKIVRGCMEGVVDWVIPFKVSIRVGQDWEKITK